MSIAQINTPKEQIKEYFGRKVRQKLEPLANNWNSRVLSHDGTKQVTDVRIKWINYASINNGKVEWSPIIAKFRQSGNSWTINTGPTDMVAPQTANRPFVLSARNPVDIFSAETFNSDALDMLIEHPQARRVEGRVNVGYEHQVVYRDALGDGVDIKFGLWHGRGPRPEIIYAFRKEPSGDSDYIEITKTITLSRGGGIPGLQTKGRMSLANGGGITSSSHPKRGFGIKPAYCWYTVNGQTYKESCELIVTWVSLGKATVTKRIPRSMISKAMKAGVELLADTTTTVYPNADPETTSVDFWIGNMTNSEVWSTKRAASSGNVHGNTSASATLIWTEPNTTTSRWDQIRRSAFLFDTSVIDDNDTVISAVKSIYGTGRDSDTLANARVVVVTSTPTSNITSSLADYSKFGTTALSNTINFSSWSTSGYNDFTLTDLTVINKTGITKLGIRDDVYDRGGTTPTWSTLANVSVSGYMAEQAGTTNDPKLVVEHSIRVGSMILGFAF